MTCLFCNAGKIILVFMVHIVRFYSLFAFPGAILWRWQLDASSSRWSWSSIAATHWRAWAWSSSRLCLEGRILRGRGAFLFWILLMFRGTWVNQARSSSLVGCMSHHGASNWHEGEAVDSGWLGERRMSRPWGLWEVYLKKEEINFCFFYASDASHCVTLQISSPSFTVMPCTSEKCYMPCLGCGCDVLGNCLPPGALPPPWEEHSASNYSPFSSQESFLLVDLLFRCIQMSAGNIDDLMECLAHLCKGNPH